MKAEAGKQYVRRDGKITGVLNNRSHSIFPLWDPEHVNSYTRQGVYLRGRETAEDLMREYQPEGERVTTSKGGYYFWNGGIYGGGRFGPYDDVDLHRLLRAYAWMLDWEIDGEDPGQPGSIRTSGDWIPQVIRPGQHPNPQVIGTIGCQYVTREMAENSYHAIAEYLGYETADIEEEEEEEPRRTYNPEVRHESSCGDYYFFPNPGIIRRKYPYNSSGWKDYSYVDFDALLRTYAWFLNWEVDGVIPLKPGPLMMNFWKPYPRREEDGPEVVGRIGCQKVTRDQAENMYHVLGEYLGYQIEDIDDEDGGGFAQIMPTAKK